jgi:hypothetical protein
MKIVYKNVAIVITVILILLTFILFWFRYQEDKVYNQRGEVLINRIETFKHVSNRLPNNVSELGFKELMNDGPYYEKKAA